MSGGDWSHGYNITQGYTHGFYREMAPSWIDFAVRSRGGVVPSDNPTADGLRYLELGCGQGTGLCVLAAANSDIDFLGVDFGAEHIAHARALAARTGLTNIRFVEADFLALGASWPADFGSFDYVALHGIYSWVPAHVRAAIDRCLLAAVRPGGLVYNSYNAMPGWVSSIPVQHILARLGDRMPGAGPAAIERGIALFDQLRENKAAVFSALPKMDDRLASLKGKDPAYLVQEYLHDNWEPQWSSQVARAFVPAKLDFAGSATLPENLLPGGFTAELRAVILGEASEEFQQDLIDCAINQTFRRDIFCRGKRAQFAGGRNPVLDNRVFTIAAFPDGPLEVKTSFGLQTIKPAVAGEVGAALASGAATVGALAKLKCFAGGNAGQSLQTLLLMMWGGQIAVGRGDGTDPAVARRFNTEIIRAAAVGAPYRSLAAPGTGNGVSLRDVDLVILQARADNPGGSARAIGKAIIAALSRLGRSIAKDGKSLSGDAELDEAERLAGQVIEEQLPRWQALGMTD